MAWIGAKSATLGEHLWRGGVGLLLMLQGFAFLKLGHGPLFVLLSMSQFGFALEMLRGCPACWVAGLVSTVGSSRAEQQSAYASGAYRRRQ